MFFSRGVFARGCCTSSLRLHSRHTPLPQEKSPIRPCQSLLYLLLLLQAFMALAKLDSDAAWTLLSTALRAHPGSSPASVSRAAPRCPDPTLFPPFQQLCPPPPAGKGVVPRGLRECSSAKLAAMLAQVEKMGARWHEGVAGKGPPS
jgi:hypothetical protein